MGQWFASFLLQDGKEVVISGRNEKKLLEVKRRLGVEVASSVEAVKSADAVLLSVPVESLEEVLKEIGPHTRPGQPVVDITSTKVFPVATMHQHIKKGIVLGTHPLFGPGARSIAHQNFVLTPTNAHEEELAMKAKEYLEARKARVTLMSPQQHDEMMAIVLGLSHFIAIVAADTLGSFDKLKELKAVGGITYRVRLTLIESVISEDPELNASLQMNLPGMAAIERTLQAKAKEWADMVNSQDRQKFVKRMKALKDRFEKDAPDFGKAYENMYRIVEGL